MSWVYFIQRGTTGPVKIGLSGNVDQRLSSLQIGSPERLRILGIRPGTAETERALHKRFKEHRIDGEWFLPVEDLLNEASASPPPRKGRKQGRPIAGVRERLMLARAIAGKNRSQASLDAGLGRTTVQLIETGYARDPSLRTVAALASALNVCPGWLAFGVGRGPGAGGAAQ